MVPVSDKSKIVRGLPLDNPISEESLGVQFYQRLLKRNDAPAMVINT